eukprot:CAMPEP_0171409202 /NCGR_PEP_ID=MMETSP0880-20121228/23846_1 /TAXON_ID=67004 /ORGANISM="Thalassiosira weissflogii, Strain CCMP1336" /LENGTH=652 /DNA_ID=CAMNT_0011925631 /DNA_START=50 /DNA_END=2011 /DNA_ORIENTATION=-
MSMPTHPVAILLLLLPPLLSLIYALTVHCFLAFFHERHFWVNRHWKPILLRLVFFVTLSLFVLVAVAALPSLEIKWEGGAFVLKTSEASCPEESDATILFGESGDSYTSWQVLQKSATAPYAMIACALMSVAFTMTISIRFILETRRREVDGPVPPFPVEPLDRTKHQTNVTTLQHSRTKQNETKNDNISNPPQSSISISNVSQSASRKRFQSVKGKVVLVTGANSGIGLETARQLYHRGAIIILACRSEKRGRAAIQDILDQDKRGRSRGWACKCSWGRGWKKGKIQEQLHESTKGMESTHEEMELLHSSTHSSNITANSSSSSEEEREEQEFISSQSASASFKAESQSISSKCIKPNSPTQRLHFLRLDLTSPSSIKEAAQTFHDMKLPLHVLINNAGVMKKEKEENGMGWEITMAANHLGHFQFTNLLLPTLRQTALQEGYPSKVITVSSCLYATARRPKVANVICDNNSTANHRFDAVPKELGIDWKDLQCTQKHYKLFEQYAQSKLANILFARELQRREQLRESNRQNKSNDNRCVHESFCPIQSYALHPGLVRTNIDRDMPWYLYYPNIVFALFVAILQKTPESGAYTSVYCSLLKDDEMSFSDDGGFYFVNSERYPLEALAVDDEDARRLWDLSSDLVELSLNEE